MSKSKLTPSEARELILAKLSHNFGVAPKEATDEHYYKAVALVVQDLMRQQQKNFTSAAVSQGKKTVYYLCMEFLMGRSLKNDLYNLGLEETMKLYTKICELIEYSLNELGKYQGKITEVNERLAQLGADGLSDVAELEGADFYEE